MEWECSALWGNESKISLRGLHQMLQSARFCELHRTYSSNISVFHTDISDILSWVIHLITKIIMSSLLTCCAQQSCLLSNKSFFLERLKVIFSHSAFLKPAPWRSTALWLKWHIFIMAFDDTSRCACIFLLNKRGHWLLYCNYHTGDMSLFWRHCTESSGIQNFSV